MSYNLNSIEYEYVKSMLKKEPTALEESLVADFWNYILPYRYLACDKKYKKDFFVKRGFKKLKIKDYEIFLNASNYLENCVDESVEIGAKPDAAGMKISDDFDYESTANYLNTIGTPLISGFCEFDKDFGQFLNNFSISLKKSSQFFKNNIKNGASLILLGEINSSQNEQKHFLAKILFDACDEILKKHLVIGLKSCSKGIFNSIVEMLSCDNFGCSLNIENLLKSPNENEDIEYLTSKAKTNMIFAVKNDKIDDFIKIVDKYEIPFSIVGKIDKEKTFNLYKNGEIIASLSKKLLFNPVLKYSENDSIVETKEDLSNSEDEIDDINKILYSKEMNTHKSIWEKFDFMTGCRSYERALYNSATELWYPEIKQYISFGLCSNCLPAGTNYYVCGQNLVCDALRKIVALGHKPFGIRVLVQIDFSKKDSIKNYKEIIKGIKYSSKWFHVTVQKIDVEVVNSCRTTISAAVVGKKKPKEKTLMQYFKNTQKIYLIGKPDNLPSTSFYQKMLSRKEVLLNDSINFRFEDKLIKYIQKMQKKKLIDSCIPVNKLGILGALIRGLSKKKLGFKGDLSTYSIDDLFNETQSRVLIGTNNPNIEKFLKKMKIPCTYLGITKIPDFIDINKVKLDCKDFYENYYKKLF